MQNHLNIAMLLRFYFEAIEFREVIFLEGLSKMCLVSTIKLETQRQLFCVPFSKKTEKAQLHLNLETLLWSSRN